MESKVETPFRDRGQEAKRSLFSRLFVGASPSAAVAEVETLLASKGPRGVGAGDVDAIYARHQLVGSERQKLSLALYEQALTAFATDSEISDAEADFLQYLRDVLNLPEHAVRTAQTSVLYPLFRAAAERAVADGVFTDDERQQMGRLAAALRVDDAVWETPYRAAADEKIRGLTADAIRDQRVSPEERRRIDEAGRDLRVGGGMDQPTYNALARFEWMWQIENGMLPAISAGIALRAKEVCHATSEAVWHELRSVTHRTNYSGLSYSIPIMKGMRYRIGTVRASPIRTDVLTEIDRGRIYITNKRLIFDGARGNKSIPYSAMLRVECYSDGMTIEKATGKSPTLLLNGDVEATALILSEALSRASGAQ